MLDRPLTRCLKSNTNSTCSMYCVRARVEKEGTFVEAKKGKKPTLKNSSETPEGDTVSPLTASSRAVHNASNSIEVFLCSRVVNFLRRAFFVSPCVI